MTLTAEKVWKRYSQGVGYNRKLDIEAEVEQNENFFIGKQWEGVQANGLPTPTFNILKRVTLFTVASITAENLKMQATPLAAAGAKGELYRTMSIINNEFDALFEHNRVGNLVREYMRNAAVDGDGCLYTWWDPEKETGQKSKGAIKTELVENTRVFFGNPTDRNVQTQPYIILEKTMLLEDVKHRAKELGKKAEDIQPDTPERQLTAYEQMDETKKVTVLLYFYRDRKTGTIRCAECTQKVILEDKDTDLKLYPITWLNWDYRQDSYHGQALISGLIPNQIYINKLYAMSAISLMTTAYPKVIYNKTLVSHWDNRVGAAIAVNGGDINNVARIMDPAQISPQISEFINMAMEHTQSLMGATSVALGDTRPDNTSAIIALQRAAATPHELTKQNLYSSIEDLGRIYLDFMANYYGRRVVESTIPKNLPVEIAQFVNMTPGGYISTEFDFSELKKIPMSIKLDVGASAYWSEIASMQTLDNLLMNRLIGVDDYLERVPDGYISKRQELLDKLRSGVPSPTMGEGQSEEMLVSSPQVPVQGGAGDGALQRKLREDGVV